MNRAWGDGAAGAGVVVGDADRHDLLAVAVGGLEDGVGNVRPGTYGSGAGAIVGADAACVPSMWEMASFISRVKVSRPSWSSTSAINARPPSRTASKNLND